MTFRITRRGALIGASALTAIGAAQAQAAPAGLGAALDAHMRKVAAFGFSGQVFAARRGEVLLDAAYGWANRHRRTAMERTNPMGVASVSKQFTAAAVMKLAERGHLSVDAPIGTYLPNAPADKAALTLHQLLTHTAGMPPSDIADDFEATSKADIVARALAAPLVGPAGAAWRYSNAGYNLVAAVIEAVSGATYEDFLTDTLFHACGMAHTGFAFHRSLTRQEPSHAYRGWLDSGAPAQWPRPNYRPWGSGTGFSTADDLYRWQRALEGGRILSQASVQRLITAHAHPGGDATLGYGYGAFVQTGEHGFFIERSGDWERGYNAAWHRWPDQDVTLIIVSNSVTPGGVSMRQSVQLELEQMLFGIAVHDAPPASRSLRRALRRLLPGEYATPEDGAITVLDDGAYVWAIARGQPAVEMLLPGIPEERRAAYRAATAKTQQLLSTMSRAAYAEALGEQGTAALDDYWNEWTGFLASYGPLQRFQVLGSSRQGPVARTFVRLTFERAEKTMLFLWAELGNGTLDGTTLTEMAPAPYACVIAGDAESAGLRGYDPMTSSTFVGALRGRDLIIGEASLPRA